MQILILYFVYFNPDETYPQPVLPLPVNVKGSGMSSRFRVFPNGVLCYLYKVKTIYQRFQDRSRLRNSKTRKFIIVRKKPTLKEKLNVF